MFLRRALRYRRSQALVLAGVSLLIGTCAVFAPWFARAVEQTVTSEALTNQWIDASWQLEAKSEGSGKNTKAPVPENLYQLLPDDLKPLFTKPAYGVNVDVGWGAAADEERNIYGKLIWRDGYCGQVEVVRGRCPDKAGEVMVSTADEKLWKVTVGQSIGAVAEKFVGGGGTLQVVGVFRQADTASTFWFGRGPVGMSHPPADKVPAASDFLLTERSTFDQGLWGQNATLDVRPTPKVATVDDLDRIEAATTTVNGDAIERGMLAQNTTGLVGVIDAIQAERGQATTIIPLVMVQVALFGAVVLSLALAAVVDQRRPEIAVARLRGAGARSTGRMLAIELGMPVLIGMLSGLLAGFGLLLLVRATWLDGGAPLELPIGVPLALVAALVVGLAVVIWSVRTVVKQPISTLLRRVVPRGSNRRVGLVDLCIIVIASAGLIAALTGGGRGPFPVLTPTLLALAAGLAFAHLLLPLAAAVSRQALRNGRLGLALGALQVSRRPAVTRIVAVVAVATALVGFAGQAASVAGHNRELRAGYETGADGILSMQSAELGDFLAALDKVDKDRNWLTPVAVAFPPSPDALRNMMIEPDSFRRIAFRGDQLASAEGRQQFRAPATPAPIELKGDTLTITASTGPMKTLIPRSINGEPPETPVSPRSIVFKAQVVSHRDGARYLVQFKPMPLVPGKTFTLSTSMNCATAGCSLLRLGITRDIGDNTGIQGDVTIAKLSSDIQASIPLGKGADWQPVTELGGNTGSLVASDGQADGGLGLKLTSIGEQNLQYRTVPRPIPILLTPGFRDDGQLAVPALDGITVPVTRVDGLTGPVNRYSDRTAVMDLTTAARLGGSVDRTFTEFEVWLNEAGLANVDKIQDSLVQAGFTPKLADVRSDRTDAYGRSASALALQLTPVVGIAGWSLAIIVLLLMVVTTWRSRAQDYASLRIAGVPSTATGRAARWEQTGPVALAALLGSACGVFGAHIALPLIPLFAPTQQPSPIPLDLQTNWGVALLLWLIGTAALTTTTLLLGTGVNRRAHYSRIREEL